ncbi:hypothetical protein LG634_10050 [Streptomyces bambusae]|uniref:hypothetical protein n=1 Tax=Streptomyces bambusae TaxID=1550616 RepID=UPI001CFDBFD5|nr:hypothetical protein [Streptomyces bambusae]MCB5165168.1 hypothetical protein [Streptomyces bambusae]
MPFPRVPAAFAAFLLSAGALTLGAGSAAAAPGVLCEEGTWALPGGLYTVCENGDYVVHTCPPGSSAVQIGQGIATCEWDE